MLQSVVALMNAIAFIRLFVPDPQTSGCCCLSLKTKVRSGCTVSELVLFHFDRS